QGRGYGPAGRWAGGCDLWPVRGVRSPGGIAEPIHLIADPGLVHRCWTRDTNVSMISTTEYSKSCRRGRSDRSGAAPVPSRSPPWSDDEDIPMRGEVLQPPRLERRVPLA